MAAFCNLILYVIKRPVAMFLRHYHPLVYRGIRIQRHGVISQNTWFFNNTTSCKVLFVSADQRDVKQAGRHPGVIAPQCRAADGRASAQPGQADQRFRGESQVQPLVTEWEHQADPVGGGCSSGLPQRHSLQRNKKCLWYIKLTCTLTQLGRKENKKPGKKEEQVVMAGHIESPISQLTYVRTISL